MSPCPGCAAPTTAEGLCWECAKNLRVIVADIGELIPELEVQITRQAVGERQPGGRSTDEPPLVFDEKASRVLDRVCRELAGLTSRLAGKPEVTWSNLSRGEKALLLVDVALVRIVELARIATKEDLTALTVTRTQAEKAVDRKIRKQPLGLCECGKGMFAFPDAVTFTCRNCQRSYDVQATREKLARAARNQRVTAAEAVRMGEMHGKKLNPATIRKWVERGKLKPLPERDPQSGDTLFRFGDLLDLVRTP